MPILCFHIHILKWEIYPYGVLICIYFPDFISVCRDDPKEDPKEDISADLLMFKTSTLVMGSVKAKSNISNICLSYN